MRLRLVSFLGMVVLGLGSNSAAYAQPQIQYESHELKVGRNYVPKLTAVLSVGEAFGEANHTHNIEVPTGRGITPQIALNYSSSAGLTEYGWGWELTLPLIERSPKKGVPTLASGYRYRNGHTIHELSWAGTDAQGWETWRETDEATYSRYIRKPGINQWTILKPDGTRLELGAGLAKRGTNPAVGMNGTQVWLANTIIDTNGNYASYIYGADPYAVFPTWNSRISSISYNGNASSNPPKPPNVTISFHWVPHWGSTPAVASSNRLGFRRTFGQDRLNQIAVNAPQHDTSGSPAKIPANSPTNRTYQFSYTAPTLQLDSTFFLTSARLNNFPPTTFLYANSWNAFSIDKNKLWIPDQTGFPRDLGLTENETQSWGTIARTQRILADVNSDGRPDLIDSSLCDFFIVWLNTGGSFERTLWNAPRGGSGIGDPDKCALRRVETAGHNAYTAQEFTDINGDGYPDIIYFPSGSSRPTLCPGNGKGFELCTYYGDAISSSPLYLRRETIPFQNYQGSITDLIDIDADGRVDSVTVDPGSGALYVHKNSGRGFEPNPSILQMQPCQWPGFPYCLRVSYMVAGAQGNRHLVADLRDMNGDGIPDFIKVDGRGSPLQISYGTGTEFLPFAQSANFPGVIGIGHQSGGGDYVELGGLHDFNGDGMLDAVAFDCRSNNLNVTVRYNNGGRWDDLPKTYTLGAAIPGTSWEAPCLQRSEIRIANGRTTIATTATLTDMNSDGLPDFVSADLSPTPQPPNPWFLVHVRVVNYRAPRKLTAAHSLNANHIMEVEYGARTGAVPYPIHAVQALKRTRTPLYTGEPTRQTSHTLSYTYGDSTFNRVTSEFGGFGTVLVSGSFGATRSATYATGDVERQPGRLILERTTNQGAQGASKTVINTYVTTPNHPAPRWTTRLLATERQLGNNEHSVTTHFVGLDDYGGVTSWIELGDPGTSQDNELHTRTYVTRDDSHFILHLPSVETVNTPGGGNGSTTRYYYDDRITLGATPTVGDLVKIENERSTGVYIAHEMFYDPFGNVIREIDPSGYATDYVYDSTYHVYRTSATNTVGTTHYSYHSLTGGIADTCGPRSKAGTWSCTRIELDALGRTTATYVPTFVNGLFGTQLLEQITYDDNVYPLQVSLVKRGTNRSIQYTDGFGNPTEVRVEETPNVFRVYETAFDALGKPLRTELRRREMGIAYSHTSPSSEAWTYVHDYVHNTIERMTHPRNPGDSSAAAFSARIVYPNRIQLRGEDGYLTNYYLDGHDRLVVAERLGGADGTARTIFTYDTDDHLTSVTDPNSLVTRYERNLLGWITSVTTPDQTVTTYSHDPRGLVLSKIDARNVLVDYTYDPLGRMTRMLSSNEPVGVRRVDARWTYYDAMSQLSEYRGLLSNEQSDGLSYGYTYTAEGEVKTITLSYNKAFIGSMTLGYESGGLLASVLYPNGMLLGYSSNLDDSLAAIVNSATQQIYASYLYEDNGQVSTLNSSLGLSEDYTYDARGRVTRIASGNDISSVPDLVDDEFAWTAGEHLSALTRRGLAPGQVPRTTPEVLRVAMDGFGRIRTVTKNGVAFASYAYDLGNRILGFREDSSGGTSTTAFSADKLISRAPGPLGNSTRFWTYDVGGNVIRDYVTVANQVQNGFTRDHSWDALGRYTGTQTDASVTSYYYSPSGRISRVVSPGEVASTADLLQLGEWARFDRTTSTWTNIIRRNETTEGDGAVVAESAGLRFEMPHRTLGNTVAAVTNDLGEVVRQEDFTPYGSRFAGASAGTLERHFHGLRTDKVVLAGVRAYDANAGSWLSRDPLVLTQPEALLEDDDRLIGSYSFNYQDPYRYTDTSGNNPAGGPPGEDSVSTSLRNNPRGRVAGPVGTAESYLQSRLAGGGINEPRLYNYFIWSRGAQHAAQQAGLKVATTTYKYPWGSFSIVDWSKYPKDIPRPPLTATFNLRMGSDYKDARAAADSANKWLHKQMPELKGQQIHEIVPVKFGGSPTDIFNKVGLQPPKHWEVNAFWKGIQRGLSYGKKK